MQFQVGLSNYLLCCCSNNIAIILSWLLCIVWIRVTVSGRILLVLLSVLLDNGVCFARKTKTFGGMALRGGEEMFCTLVVVAPLHGVVYK